MSWNSLGKPTHFLFEVSLTRDEISEAEGHHGVTTAHFSVGTMTSVVGIDGDAGARSRRQAVGGDEPARLSRATTSERMRIDIAAMIHRRHGCVF